MQRFLIATVCVVGLLVAVGRGWGGEPQANQEKPAAPKVRDLGPPLIDDAGDLKKLHPQCPVWLDIKRKQVVLLAEVCRAQYPQEFFATYRARAYESVVVADVKPSTVHAGLLALGADPGRPATVEPKFAPASGTEIDIEVRWKDRAGRRQTARAQDWIRDIKTKEPLDIGWVFGGSRFWKDESTGRHIYTADPAGDLISVSNIPTATLDLPMHSGTALEARLFESNTDRMPPEGTAVTVVLTPRKMLRGQ